MEADVKASLADLTKLPAKEFEKHFQEWMERDDVAKALQAKLRFDLIKNFNKTSLGKQMMAQTLNPTVNGSSYRLTLSSFILALNTLVAEFLYAQNCHYTLSVFCTEIPFRNAVPDFESMRNFRFNDTEINDIWEAITGSSTNLKSLHRTIAKIYHEEPHNSLLLSILKHLIMQRPEEMLKRTVQVQTDIVKNHSCTKSTSVQVSDSSVSHTLLDARRSKIHQDNRFRKFNKYLQVLSNNVSLMTQKFEDFNKSKSVGKKRPSKFVSLRDYRTMGRSLERITHNLKQTSYAKRKNKRQRIMLRAIQNLTGQFRKCSEHFQEAWQSLQQKREYSETMKKRMKDKQTETMIGERSYSQWIFEMRNTSNGKKFLHRIETSLFKAMAKHKEEIESELQIKTNHIRGLLKIHYKQKLLTHLSRRDFKEDTMEVHKLNENITKKLQEFELKQAEMLQKLQLSTTAPKHISTAPKTQSNNNKEEPSVTEKPYEVNDPLLKNTQKQLDNVFKNLNNEQELVNNIIYGTKLRLQELEQESNRIEEQFLSYLDRQKQEKFQDIIQKKESPRIPQLIKTFHQSFKQLRRKLSAESEEEYLQMKQQLQETHLKRKQRAPANSRKGSSTSSEELENAIVAAKEKFFEKNQRYRQRKRKQFLQETLNTKEDTIGSEFQLFYDNTKFDKFQSGNLSKQSAEVKYCENFETGETQPLKVKRQLFPNNKNEIFQDNGPRLKYFEPIKITDKGMKKVMAFDEMEKDADAVKKSMNKIQKLFEEHTAVQENGVEESKIIWTNFTKALEKYLTPGSKTITTPATTTTTSTNTINITTEETPTKDEQDIITEIENLPKISNISMPPLLDTSSSSGENVQSKVPPEAQLCVEPNLSEKIKAPNEFEENLLTENKQPLKEVEIGELCTSPSNYLNESSRNTTFNSSNSSSEVQISCGKGRKSNEDESDYWI